ncbi:MAG: TlpA family protein disulfide reductase [Alphaproteobacteria bacterium]|nr:TlpA family protein disulfide reductase [Alphaproteobacteria bacterium]
MKSRLWTFVLLACLAAGAACAAEPRPFQRGDFAAIRAAHQGRPVVVNFWSVTCPPCLAELPTLKAMAEANPRVALVFIAADTPDDGERIEHLLKRNGLDGAESWVFADANATRLRFDIDRTWRGELPRTYLIAASGRVESHSGRISGESLNAWLEGQ